MDAPILVLSVRPGIGGQGAAREGRGHADRGPLWKSAPVYWAMDLGRYVVAGEGRGEVGQSRIKPVKYKVYII
jgi:hypothetical protein